MSNTNPFVPKGSLLEQQSQRRSRLKLAVFCTVSIGVVGLVAMLIQGCKRDTDADSNLAPLTDNPTNNAPTDAGTNSANTNPPIDTNQPPTMPPAAAPTNGPTTAVPIPTVPVTPITPVAPTPVSGSQYVIVKGDTLSKIAKKNGVSLKALEDANPGVDSKHLHVGKSINLPAGGSAVAPTAGATPDATPVETTGGTTYTVKSGDTLHKIAKKFHVSVKAIEAANHLSTATIKVGKKLKIPGGKTEVAAPVAAPVVTAPVVPAAPPVSTTMPPPVPASVPAPAAPSQQ